MITGIALWDDVYLLLVSCRHL